MRNIHAHFTYMILYSTASIEASLDYYTNKNIILERQNAACIELI